MASIRERTSKAGETSWAVLYRHGTRQASKTLGSEKDAERFRTLVEALGPDRAIAELENDDQRTVLRASEANSYAAFRRIRLFPTSAAVVRQRMVGLAPGELVFTNSHGRLWNQNTFLRETWPRIVTDAGLWKGAGKSPTPHFLRHMHVAVLGASGVPMQEIQRRIGHESIQTTINVYGGMIGDLSDDALTRAADIMAGRRGAPSIAVVPGEVLGTVTPPLEA